jgi:hypothetical protein
MTRPDTSHRRSAWSALRLDAWWQAAIVVVVCCSVSVVVRAPYRHCYFAGDDMNLLAEIGLARCGKLSWLEVWTAVIGPHAMILWKSIFSLECFAFGLDPVKFHTTIAIVHGLTAALLFWLCRLWPVGLPAASTASLAWAAAAIGGWDNPTLWLMCGGLSVGLGFFLLAMCFAAQLGADGGGRSALGMAVCFGLAMLTWSDLALLAPVLLLELSWRGLWSQSRWRLATWLTAFVVPMVCVGPLLGWLIIGEVVANGRPRRVDVQQVALRATGQLSVALATLTYGQVAPPDILASTHRPTRREDGRATSDPVAATSPGNLVGVGTARPHNLRYDEPLWPKQVLAGSLLAVMVVLRKHIAWRLLSLFALIVVIFLVAANTGGFSMSFRDALNHGHYLFLPCLLWCVAAGCLAQAIWPRSPRGRVTVTALGVLLLAAFLLHQRQVAVISAQIHDTGFSRSTDAMRGIQSVLARLAQRGAANGETIRLPDTPIGIEAGYYPCWPLAAFSALCAPDGLPRLEIIAIQDSDTPDFDKAIASLRALDDAYARQLADTMSRAYPLLKALLWLDQEVHRTGQVVEVPNGMVQLPSGAVALQAVWRYEVSSPSGNDLLRFRDNWQAGRFDQEFPRLAALLRSSTSSEARYLLATFAQ